METIPQTIESTIGRHFRVMPFNDYSGNYSAVNYKTYLNGSETDAPYVKIMS